MGATGTISKSFRKYVRNIPENMQSRNYGTTENNHTAHILRKAVM
jgi:hypothetical protein